MTSMRRRVGGVAVGLALLLLVALGATACSGGSEDTSSTAMDGTTASDTAAETEARAPEAAPGSSEVEPLPEAIAGYRLIAVGVSTYRISYVFRLRNAILNGLSGGASAHVVDTVQAKRRGVTSLLTGVIAAPAADVPDVPRETARLIGARLAERTKACNRPVGVRRSGDSVLALLDVDPRWALIAIGARRSDALELIDAAARAVVAECPAP